MKKLILFFVIIGICLSSLFVNPAFSNPDGFGGGDNLGNHTATQDLNMNDYNMLGASVAYINNRVVIDSPTYIGNDLFHVNGGKFVVKSTGNVRIHEGASGTSIGGVADDFVIEGAGTTGLSIYSPDGNTSNIYMGSPSDNNGAIFRWSYATRQFLIGTSNPDGAVVIKAGNFVDAVIVNESSTTVKGNHVVDGQYGSDIYDVGSASNTIAIDWNNGNNQQIELIGTSTFTFTNGLSGRKYTLAVKQDGTGSRTTTWPVAVNWGIDGEVVLTTTINLIDYIGFIYNNLESEYHALGQKKGF